MFAVVALSSLAMICNASGIASLAAEDDDEIEMVIKEVEAAREKGLPYYFNPDANGSRMVIESDVDASWVYDNEGNRCIFFIQPLKSSEEVQFIAIWMYNESSGKVSKIFSQNEANFGNWNINKIKILHAEIPDGDKKIGTPMLVLACLAATLRPTASQATIFLHPASCKTKTLEDEVLVEGLYQESADYITTVTRQIAVEELSDFEAERRAAKLFITPVLKVYTTYGELVREIKLPTYDSYNEY